ncbi:hypothetical protein QZH41_016248 [Actinostola sp. cb2023]|nr:hypothetical protein QZH41_016248 [Actinostola sp. cb2023]
MDGDEEGEHKLMLELHRVYGPSLDPSKVWYAIPNSLMPNGRKEDFVNCDLTKFCPNEILEVPIEQARDNKRAPFRMFGAKKKNVVVATAFGLMARTLRMKNLNASKFLKSNEFLQLKNHLNSFDFKMAGKNGAECITANMPETPPETPEVSDQETSSNVRVHLPPEVEHKSLESLRESKIGPRVMVKKAGKIAKSLINDVKKANKDDQLGTVLGYHFCCGEDNDKEFERDTISTALSVVAEKSGYRKAFKDMISQPVYGAFIDTTKVPDWVQLVVKLTTKMPDQSWQTMLNFLNLGRSGKAVDAGILLSSNEIRAKKSLVFHITREMFNISLLPSELRVTLDLKALLMLMVDPEDEDFEFGGRGIEVPFCVFCDALRYLQEMSEKGTFSRDYGTRQEQILLKDNMVNQILTHVFSEMLSLRLQFIKAEECITQGKTNFFYRGCGWHNKNADWSTDDQRWILTMVELFEQIFGNDYLKYCYRKDHGTEVDDESDPRKKFIYDHTEWESDYGNVKCSNVPVVKKRPRAKKSLVFEIQEDDSDKTANGHPEETANDHPDETANDHPEETANDHPDETANDHPDETANDHPDETANDHPDETANDHPDETASDHPDETANDHADETANDHPDETANGHPEETANDHPEETANDHPDETANDHPEETANDHPDETANDHPDETDNGHPVIDLTTLDSNESLQSHPRASCLSSSLTRQQFGDIDIPSVMRSAITKKDIKGSGTFGICYLAFYRGMTVVVKELKSLKNSKTATDDAAAKRTKEELLYEADIIRKLGDHPGLPLLFGVCSRNQPYKLILQFHGETQSSLTIARALHSKRITTKREWDVIVKMSAEALHHVHSMGFLHNDLKSNNILLEKRGNSYAPIIIDFGKSRDVSNPKAGKNVDKNERERYKLKYPHIAPEIVEGRGGQSLASDIFSFAKIVEDVYKKCQLGQLPELLLRCLSANPQERPSCREIIAVF